VRMGGLKCLPVIAEDLFEGIFVNMFHSRLGRSVSSCYKSDKISVKDCRLQFAQKVRRRR
jgi:hypothetical protein